jgi:CRP-like cAMP-binding protein
LSDQEIIQRAFARTPILARIPAASARTLASHASVRRYAQGTFLHRVDQPVPGLYAVMEGSLELSRLRPDGNCFVVEYLGTGSLSGVVGTIDGGRALFDVRAHEPVTVVLVPRAALRAEWQRHPELLHALSIEVCERNRAIYEHVERLATLPLRERMAHALVTLAARQGHKVPGGIEIGLKLSQDDLAAYLSASRQRTNVELRKLVAQHVVKTAYSRLTIVDLDALRRSARRAFD